MTLLGDDPRYATPACRYFGAGDVRRTADGWLEWAGGPFPFGYLGAFARVRAEVRYHPVIGD